MKRLLPFLLALTLSLGAQQFSGGSGVAPPYTIPSTTTKGLFTTTIIATPVGPSLATVGAPGSTSYTYAIEEVVDTMHGTGAAGSETTISTGNATLDSTNYITISAPPCAYATDTVRFFRVSNGASLQNGQIGSLVNCSTTNSVVMNDTGSGVTVNTNFQPEFKNMTGMFVGHTLNIPCGGDPLKLIIGFGANCGTAPETLQEAIGPYAVTLGTGSLSIGGNTVTQDEFDTAVGNAVFIPNTRGTAVGYSAEATGTSDSLAIGYQAASTAVGAVAFGNNAINAVANSFSGGSPQVPLNIVSFGTGLTTTGSAPPAWTLSGSATSGANLTGGELDIEGGNGTGTGGSGAIVFKTAPAGTAGSTANTETTGMTITSAGVVQVAIVAQLPRYTVSTLPPSPAAGFTAVVTDASTFAIGTCVGSGSDYMIAVYNGTAWTCH